MKISYDAEVDALSITFRETTVWPKASRRITTAQAVWPGWKSSTRKSVSAAADRCAKWCWRD